MKVRAAAGAPFGDKEAKKIVELFRREFPDGEVTPKEVLEIAKNPDSILHRHFDWNDSSAAAKYRIIQARKIITGIVIGS